MDVLTHKVSDEGGFSLEQEATDCRLCQLTVRQPAPVGHDRAEHIALFRDKFASAMQIYLEINRNCNLICTHCYNDSGPGYRDKLSLDDIERMLDWLAARKAPLEQVLLSGGEPILHPDFAAILHATSSRGIKTKVISNGTTLSPRVVDLLVAQGAYVQVSLTGHTAEQDGIIRGERTFDRCLAGIERLVAAGLNTLLSVSVVVHRDNFRSIGEIIDLLAGMGVRRVGLSTLSRQGRGLEHWDSLRCSIADLFEASLVAGRKRQQYKDQIEVYTSGLVFLSLPSLIRGESVPVLPCTAHYEASVTYRGHVIFCEHFQRITLGQGSGIHLHEVLGDTAA
jgi:MoaA/NifB/PqqE/SkfB family radical SAM enzyme